MLELNSLTITDQKLNSSLDSVHRYAEEIMADRIDIYFTDHSIKHLDRILILIDNFLTVNNKVELLNDIEKYVLICAVYLHDIGMQYERGADDPKKRRKDHHKLSATLICRDFKDIGLIEELVSIVALIAEGHRGNLDERYNTKVIGTGLEVRCDLLASILYLCDELDVSFERVNIKKMHYLEFNPEASLHFYKHYYTQGVIIEENRCIKIVFRYPKDRAQQYNDLFEPIIIEKLKGVLKDITPILQAKYELHIILREQDIEKEINEVLEEISPVTFEKIYSYVSGAENYVFLRELSLEALIGDVKPELFFGGNVRWADIVNNLDIERQQYDIMKKNLKELYDLTCQNQSLTCLLICGEGGSGKTTALMRLAYDTTLLADFNMAEILWWPGDTELSLVELRKLNSSEQKPILLFIDGTNIDYIISNIREYEKEYGNLAIPITLVVASRLNEWINAGGKYLGFSKHLEVQLDVLSDLEIEHLLGRLEEYNELHELVYVSYEERFKTFKDKSERQLLVAMLEATRGMGFYEIIKNEYEKIKVAYPQAAIAYETICLFNLYDVLIPENLLITLVQCNDYDDFEERVLLHTHLVFVRQSLSKFGIFYKARHKEIARVLIENLPEYDTSAKQLKRIGFVLRTLDIDERQQRYVIIDFLNNYLIFIIKTYYKVDYDDKIEEIRQFIYKHDRIHRLTSKAYENRRFPELVLWNRLFGRLRLLKYQIRILENMVSIDMYDQKANYMLAKVLSKTMLSSSDPGKIAQYYQNSYVGGNRTVRFVFDFLAFCISHNLKTQLDKLVSELRNFVHYTPEEKDLKIILEEMLRKYVQTKEFDSLSSSFSSLFNHVAVRNSASGIDELTFLRITDANTIAEKLDLEKKYLIVIEPNRPMNTLLHIAYYSTRLSGKEQDAIDYFREIFNSYIKGKATAEHYDILMEYGKFAIRTKLENKDIIYGLLKLAKRLKPTVLDAYVELSEYAKICGDISLAKNLCNEGIGIATKFGKYDTFKCKSLRHLLEKLQ